MAFGIIFHLSTEKKRQE